MKNNHWLLLILVALFLPGCRDEEPAKSSKIRFALSTSVVTGGQGRQATSLPEGVSIYVSIRRISGDEVYTLKQVNLLRIGNDYISEPLALEGGNYELTDFLVADGNGTVVFATPKEGSELAPWVDDPLPQPFAVSDNAVAQVTVQVLPTGAHEPQQFGYVTFHVDVVMPPAFRLAVFRPEGAALVFAPAHVYLLAGGDTIFSDYLPAQINTINLPLVADTLYRLIVQEDGFTRHDEYLAPEDLTDGVLEVVLQPAFTFVVNDDHPGIYSWLRLSFEFVEGNEGKRFWVDWGDGVAGYYTVSEIQSGGLNHQYADTALHFVSISGNLDVFWWVRFISVPGKLRVVSVQHLPAMELFFVEPPGVTPATIDFSHNPKLATIYTEYASFQTLDVSHNPLLTYILLNGNTQFTTASIDAFISSLYDAVTSQPPGPASSGFLNIAYSTRADTVAIGPPSEAARVKLRALANNYGWGIHPQKLLQP